MNAFLNYSEEKIVAPRRRKLDRLEAKEQVAPSPLEKKLEEQSKLRRSYLAWKREKYRTALNGPYGLQLASLRRLVRRFGAADARSFCAAVEAETWFLLADKDTRHMAFQIVSKRIQRIRASQGLPIFDDALPGEADCVLTRCKKHILGGY